jgi:hypothetical protein
MSAEPEMCECGERKIFAVSMPAKTSMRWGDSGCGASSNINGVFDRGLGTTYKNSMERDAICKAKGLIPLSDVGGDHFVADRLSAEKDIKAKQDAILASYHNKVAEYGGDKQAQVKAIQEILPASDCLGNEGNVDILSANSFTGQSLNEDI